MSHINTSSVTKRTKEEGGDFSGNHPTEAKGAYKFPFLLLAKILLAKKPKNKRLHFEHKFGLALGLENPGSFCVCLVVSSCTDFLAIPA